MSKALQGNKETWIVAGYEAFAINGKSGLKIEPMAKLVGTSKSSFYHYFSDMEIFMEYLFKYHIQRSQIIAEKERNSKNIDPELINILVEHKIDLLFNKQLRVNKNIADFAKTLDISNKTVGDAFKIVWIKELNFQLTPKQIDAIFELALDNFFLNINEETLNYNWLSDYFIKLSKLTDHFI